MTPEASYEGPPIDGGYQHFQERPAADDDAEETVYATDPDPDAEVPDYEEVVSDE